METRLYLNIEEMVKRSNGRIRKERHGQDFPDSAASGGILQKDAASNLVFDMHNEYGLAGNVRGVDQHGQGPEAAIPIEVAVFSLDEQSSRTRGINPDYLGAHRLGGDRAEDVQMLRESLNLSEVAADAAYSLQRKFGAKSC